MFHQWHIVPTRFIPPPFLPRGGRIRRLKYKGLGLGPEAKLISRPLKGAKKKAGTDRFYKLKRLGVPRVLCVVGSENTVLAINNA